MNFLAFSILLAHFFWSVIHHNALFYLYLLIVVIYTAINFLHSITYRNTFRRKMQIATWLDGGNPRILGRETFDWTQIQADLVKQSYPLSQLPPRAIIFTKAFAMAIDIAKKATGKITFGTFIALPSVDFSVQVHIKRGEIGWVLLRECEKKSIRELTKEYQVEADRLRKGTHTPHKYHMQLIDKLPAFLVQLGMRVAMFFAHDCGLPIPFLKLEKHPFGICSIADISDSGLSDSYAALNPLMKCAIGIQLGKPQDRVVAVEDRVEIRQIINMNVVFDHRFADGADGSKMIKELGIFMGNLGKHLRE